MQIVPYNKSQLNELINSEFFKSLIKIPISYQRALSQINNPYCSEDDILLWAAYENASLVGYIGALPDLITLNGSENKIYWVSCFWVSDKQRTQNLASQLFFLILKNYRERLLFSNFLFSLEKTYQSLGVFKPTQYIKGVTLYRNLCFAPIIEARYPELEEYIPFYRSTEKFLNKALKIRDIFVRNFRAKYRIEDSKVFDDEFKAFLKNYQESHPEIVVRDAEHFDWIISYPWILTKISEQEDDRYYFSSKSSKFEYLSVKFYNHDKLEGFLFLNIRDKDLSVYYVYAENELINCISNYISVISKKYNFDKINCFEPRLTEALSRKRNGYIYKKKSKRPYILPRNFEINASVFQDGDGDAVFT